jgi:hypothetical protein
VSRCRLTSRFRQAGKDVRELPGLGDVRAVACLDWSRLDAQALACGLAHPLGPESAVGGGYDGGPGDAGRQGGGRVLVDGGAGLNSRSVPSAHCRVWGSQSWNRNRRASWGSLVGSTPSQSGWNMASRWVWMSSSMLFPSARSGTYAAGHTSMLISLPVLARRVAAGPPAAAAQSAKLAQSDAT